MVRPGSADSSVTDSSRIGAPWKASASKVALHPAPLGVRLVTSTAAQRAKSERPHPRGVGRDPFRPAAAPDREKRYRILHAGAVVRQGERVPAHVDPERARAGAVGVLDDFGECIGDRPEELADLVHEAILVHTEPEVCRRLDHKFYSEREARHGPPGKVPEGP